MAVRDERIEADGLQKRLFSAVPIPVVPEQDVAVAGMRFGKVGGERQGVLHGGPGQRKRLLGIHVAGDGQGAGEGQSAPGAGAAGIEIQYLAEYADRPFAASQAGGID